VVIAGIPTNKRLGLSREPGLYQARLNLGYEGFEKITAGVELGSLRFRFRGHGDLQLVQMRKSPVTETWVLGCFPPLTRAPGVKDAQRLGVEIVGFERQFPKGVFGAPSAGNLDGAALAADREVLAGIADLRSVDRNGSGRSDQDHHGRHVSRLLVLIDAPDVG